MSTRAAPPPLLVYLTIGAWVFYSCVLVVWLYYREGSPPIRALHLFDILWIILITWLTQGPFFTLFTFSLVAAGFRWGFPETMSTVAVNIVILSIEAFFGKGTHRIIPRPAARPFRGQPAHRALRLPHCAGLVDRGRSGKRKGASRRSGHGEPFAPLRSSRGRTHQQPAHRFVGIRAPLFRHTGLRSDQGADHRPGSGLAIGNLAARRQAAHARDSVRRGR